MKNLAKLFLLAILALGMAAPAQAHWWWAHPSIVLYGPVVYPPPYGAYGPYYPNYVVVAATGRIEIKTEHLGNRIYLDGGLVGRTGGLKKFWVRTGNHSIVIKDSLGKVLYQEQVQVLRGKKLKLDIDHQT